LPSDVRAALDENTIEGATPERAVAEIHSMRSNNSAPSIERLPAREAGLQHRAGVRAAPENMSKTLDLITASSDASALGHI